MEAAVSPAHSLDPEDRTRSDLYALLAKLYEDGPDSSLRDAIAGAPRMDGTSDLAVAWNRLIEASAGTDARDALQEYTDLFIGVGKSEVNLHGSFWLSGFTMERPLALLRSELAVLGFARRDGVSMLEDHLSALCETMRLLIAGDSQHEPAPLATQRAFFERNLASWVFDCCDAIDESPIANYYRHVAELTRAFMTIDREALAMDD